MSHDCAAPPVACPPALPNGTLFTALVLVLLGTPVAALGQAEVSVFATDDTASETPPDDGEFVVRRTGGDEDGPLRISYEVGGTATPGADYEPLPRSLNLGDGQAEMAIPVRVTGDDGVVEGDETVTITLLADDGDEGPGGGSGNGGVVIGEATATITIRDSEYQVTAAPAGDAAEDGPADGEITISLGTPNASGAPLAVRYDVGGSATPSLDYVALPGVASIEPGESSTSVVVTPLDDDIVEGAESVELTLTGTDNPQVGIGSPANASITIADDDEDSGDDGDGDDDGGDDEDAEVRVSIVASDDTASETGRDDGEFTVQRVGGDPEREVTVNYAVGGSATPDDDYGRLSGSVRLRKNRTEEVIRVRARDDAAFEGDETVTLTLAGSAGEVIVVDGTATVSIRDGAHAVSTTAAGNAAEPAQAGRITVSLDGTNASGRPLTVEYSVGGSATPGLDYAALSGSATIEPGASSAAIAVTPLDDAEDEADETVVVTLTATGEPAVAIGSPASASVSIGDDDEPAGGGGDDGGDDGDGGGDGGNGGGDGGDGGTGGGPAGSADPDGDGLTNDDEEALGTDPALADTDGDGVNDGDEAAAGSDPLEALSFADGDGDLVPDAVEAADGTRPDDPASFADGDRGGTADHLETVLFAAFGLPATSAADPRDDARDFDGDGLPDRLELSIGSDALSADAPTPGGASDDDGDGVSNALEARLATLHIADVDRASDRDRDGYPDAAEITLGLDPLTAAAPDADSDGVPDVIEALAGVDADGATDSDGDGVPDAREIAQGADPLDASSPVANGAADDDDDGISNAIENVLGLLGVAEDAAADGDADGDGIADADEIRRGTDPRHDEQPALWIELAQGQTGGVNALVAGGGDAVARARVGGSQTGAFTWDWSGSSDAVLAVASGPQDASALAFSPETLPPGPYTLAVKVRRTVGDYTSPESSVEFPFVVLESGTNAAIADGDGDGVPDAADGAEGRAGLAHELEAGSGGRMQAEPGARLQVGATARTARTGSARVAPDDIAAHGDGRGEAEDNVTDDFSYPGGIYDFEIANLPEVGASARVVIPLGVGIGELAEYRKHQPARGWGTFVENERNALASAAGGATCPPPGDAAYTQGLTPGDLCVQLTIEDGGPNDGDAELGPNGLIRDPGGVGAPEGTVTVGQGSGSAGPWSLLLLALFAGIPAGLRYQRRTRPVSRCTKSDSG